LVRIGLSASVKSNVSPGRRVKTKRRVPPALAEKKRTSPALRRRPWRERERLQASREPETSLLVPVWVTGVGVSVQEQGTPYAEAAMPFGPASCLSTLAGGPGTTPWSGGAAGGPGREAGRRRVLSSALS
jgi:hypothetical protein